MDVAKTSLTEISDVHYIFKRIIYPFLALKNEVVSFTTLIKHLSTQGYHFNSSSLKALLEECKDYILIRKDAKAEQETVEAVTKIEFCKNFNGKKNCVSNACDMLHVCRHFVKGKCNFGKKCNKPHTFNDPNTKQLLEAYYLLGLPEEALRTFLCRHVQYCLDESETEVPKHLEICHYYNVAPGCNRGNDCPYLHICKFYATEGSCKFSKQCMRSHTLASEHSQMILHRYGHDEKSALLRFQEENLIEKQINEKKPPFTQSSPLKSDNILSPSGNSKDSKPCLPNPYDYFLSLEKNILNLPCGTFQKGQRFQPTVRTSPITIGPWKYNYRSYGAFGKGFDLLGDCKSMGSVLLWQNSLQHLNALYNSNNVLLNDKSNNIGEGKNSLKLPPNLNIQENNEICCLHLQSPTLEHPCSHFHTSEPFCWQVCDPICSNGSNWNDLGSVENQKVEEAFCNVKNISSGAICLDEALTIDFTTDLGISRQNQGQICKFAAQKKSMGVTIPLLARRLSTRSNLKDVLEKAYTVWRWYHCDDNGNWCCYDDEEMSGKVILKQAKKINSTEIEKKFCKPGQAYLVFERGSSHVMIDFIQMVEINLKTKCQRKLRRRPVYLPMILRNKNEISEKKVRYSWPDLRVSYGNQRAAVGETFHMIDLPDTSQPYKRIALEFYKSMKCGDITKIESIQNMQLLTAFRRKRDEMEQNNQQSPREKYLFHGLDSAAEALCVCDKGLSTPRDKATYFAGDANLAHERVKATSQRPFQMIIFRVIIPMVTGVGQPTYLPQRKMATTNPMDELFCRFRNDPPLYAIYSCSHAYPEYLVTYCTKS